MGSSKDTILKGPSLCNCAAFVRKDIEKQQEWAGSERGGHLLNATQPWKAVERASGSAFRAICLQTGLSCPAHVPQNELNHHPKTAVL